MKNYDVVVKERYDKEKIGNEKTLTNIYSMSLPSKMFKRKKRQSEASQSLKQGVSVFCHASKEPCQSAQTC